VRTVSYDIGSAAAGALAGTGVHGTAALVIDTTRRVVLGATFVGPGVGEMLHSATIGHRRGGRLGHAVARGAGVPTLSEVWLRLLAAERGVS